MLQRPFFCVTMQSLVSIPTFLTCGERKSSKDDWKKEEINMREIDPAQTRRAAAFQLWMSAPMPMVTLFKTLDVTPLVRWSKKYH